MAGIDKSDFHPLGRPQLSSTVGPYLDGAASLTGGQYQDVWAKTDASSLVKVRKAMFEIRLPRCCCVIPSVLFFHLVCSL